MSTASSPGGVSSRLLSDRLARIGNVGRRHVDAGRIPCSVVQLAVEGEPVYTDVYGMADVERSVPVSEDTIFRIYSMTKPITSAVLMSLYEEGEFLLEDPVDRFLPSFADMLVWSGGSDMSPSSRPAATRMTVKDLLTHTSGLTYGFVRQHPLDAIYRNQGLGDFAPHDNSLDDAVRKLGELPLLFDPGTSWNYSMATDVCGAVIEAIVGKPLDQVFRERVFDPLGMPDTGFQVPEGDADRLAALYLPTPSGGMALFEDPVRSAYLKPPVMLSGGGGLVSTLGDYQKFCDLLLGGGEAHGHRLLGPRTLSYMASNHLPNGVLLNDLGQSLFSEVSMEGTGFGLGFSVVEDPPASGAVCTRGEFAWGGAASTAFWIDPVERLTVMFLTQLLPSSTYPMRRELRAAVYAALA